MVLGTVRWCIVSLSPLQLAIRSRFEQAWYPYMEAKGRWDAMLTNQHPLNVEFDQAIRAALRESGRRIDTEKAYKKELAKMDPAWLEVIRQPFAKRAAIENMALDVELDLLRDELTRLATRARPSCDLETWRQIHWIYGGSYGSQGMGSEHYLDMAAKLETMRAEALGVPTRIEKYPGGVYILGQLDEPWDVDIVRFAPVDFKAQVKVCLAGGCNPRVIWPGFPIDGERSLGFDYFGKELG